MCQSAACHSRVVRELRACRLQILPFVGISGFRVVARNDSGGDYSQSPCTRYELQMDTGGECFIPRIPCRDISLLFQLFDSYIGDIQDRSEESFYVVGILYPTELAVDNPRGIGLYDFLRLGDEQNQAVDALVEAVEVYARSFGLVAVEYILAGEQ